MASILQILRRIGGTKAAPAVGSAGQLALWKAGVRPIDATSLYAHDGTQWVEVLDTSAKWEPDGANVYRAAGSVGIGGKPRASTTALLDVSGDLYSLSMYALYSAITSDHPTLELVATKGTVNKRSFRIQANNGVWILASMPDNRGSSIATLLSATFDGNIGFGHDAPTERVDVKGTVKANKVKLADATPQFDFYPTTGTVDKRAFRIEASHGQLRFIGIKDDGTEVTFPLKLDWVNGKLHCETVEVSNGHVYIKSQRAENADFTLDSPKADGTPGGKWLFSCHVDNGFEIYNGILAKAFLQVTGDGRFRFFNGKGVACLGFTVDGWMAVGGGTAKVPLDISGAQAANIVDATATGALDMEAGNNFKIDATAPVTVSFAKHHSARAYHATLRLKNGAGKVTWDHLIKWPGGTAPTLTAGVDLFEFYSDDSYTAWYGKHVGSYT
jgi:hypothetical protein